MASIAMLVGGALVNALAFSGSNYLFSMLRSSGVDEERKRHATSSFRPRKPNGPEKGLSA
jgi:hypothetical protein